MPAVNIPTPNPSPFRFGFPLRENCDPNNPYEAFLWMLVALPGINGGQLIVGLPALQEWAKHLWDMGLRQVEPPLKKYRKPSNMDPNFYTSPGDWVPIDAPDPDPRPPARRAVDSLGSILKAEVLREIAKDMTPRQLCEFLEAARREAEQQ